MIARNFNIIIIFLFCCALYAGQEENSVEKTDPNEPQKESAEDSAFIVEAGENDLDENSVEQSDPNIPVRKIMGYKTVKDQAAEHYLYIPVYEDGSEGPPEKSPPKGKPALDEQSYYLKTGLKKESWFIGPEVYQFNYEEPGMEEEGMFYGIHLGYTYREWVPETKNKWPGQKMMYKVEFRFATGSVDYDGQLMDGTPYKMSNIDDRAIETRYIFGQDFINQNSLTTLYTGFGYRYLNDDSSSDPAGYDRKSNYFYLPLGLQFNQISENPWSMAATIEADLLIYGIQKSDLDVVVINNHQYNGLGYRAAVKFQKISEDAIFIIEPFFRYWDIGESDKEYIGSIYFIEPENETTEFGVQVKWLF